MPLPIVWTSTGFYALADVVDVYAATGPSLNVPTGAGVGVFQVTRINGRVWWFSAHGGTPRVELCGRGGVLLAIGRRGAADRCGVYLERFNAGDVAGLNEGPDGGVDITDLLAWLAWFEAGDVRADFDGNGGVTIDDVLAFLAAFEAGGACGP